MSRSRPAKARAARSCGNHGGCPWCEGNRLHANTRRCASADLEEQLDAMCDCPACRGGHEALCWASLAP